MTKIAQGTVPEYDHHQLAGGSNQETRGLNSHGSVERCDLLPRESLANEVTMEQFERCELDAIEGPSLGRLQTQMLLQVADMLSIDAENGALLATAAAAMQSMKAMADDCRAHLLVLHTELDEAYYDDRLSDCAQRAAESIYLVIDITETELEQIESDALAVLDTIAERCIANAARVAQLQAHVAELLGRMGEPNTHATTGQAIMSDVNARNAAPPRPDQSLPAMGDTSATAQYVDQSRLPPKYSIQVVMALRNGAGSPVIGAGSPVIGASAPPTLPVFEAHEPTANSATPHNDNDIHDDGDGTFHCETAPCSGGRPPDKTTRPNRFFILRHATSIQRINEGAVHGMGARGDAHTHESGPRSKLTPPECAMTASSVAPEILEKVADVRLAYSSIDVTTVVINALKFAHRARAERDYLLSTMD